MTTLRVAYMKDIPGIFGSRGDGDRCTVKSSSVYKRLDRSMDLWLCSPRNQEKVEILFNALCDQIRMTVFKMSRTRGMGDTVTEWLRFTLWHDSFFPLPLPWFHEEVPETGIG